MISPGDFDPGEISEANASVAKDKGGKILGVIRNISAVVAVIILMIIGIKYMVGSVEEKANYKATMFPYIVGAVMAVGGTALISAIYEIMK